MAKKEKLVSTWKNAGIPTWEETIAKSDFAIAKSQFFHMSAEGNTKKRKKSKNKGNEKSPIFDVIFQYPR